MQRSSKSEEIGQVKFCSALTRPRRCYHRWGCSFDLYDYAFVLPFGALRHFDRHPDFAVGIPGCWLLVVMEQPPIGSHRSSASRRPDRHLEEFAQPRPAGHSSAIVYWLADEASFTPKAPARLIPLGRESNDHIRVHISRPMGHDSSIKRWWPLYGPD